MKKNKYVYLHVVQGMYNSGWEDLTQSESYREAREDLKAYRENEGGCFRMIKRRELNSDVSEQKHERVDLAGFEGTWAELDRIAI